MREYWKTVREYAWNVGRAGHVIWALLIGEIFGYIAAANDIGPLAEWMWFAMFCVTAVIAPFMSFHRLRLERDEYKNLSARVPTVNVNIEGMAKTTDMQQLEGRVSTIEDLFKEFKARGGENVRLQADEGHLLLIGAELKSASVGTGVNVDSSVLEDELVAGLEVTSPLALKDISIEIASRLGPNPNPHWKEGRDSFSVNYRMGKSFVIFRRPDDELIAPPSSSLLDDVWQLDASSPDSVDGSLGGTPHTDDNKSE